jgi:hypothetical protein
MYKRQLNVAGFRGTCHYIYNIGAMRIAIPPQLFLWIGINNTNVGEKRIAVIPQSYVVRGFEIDDVSPDRLSHSTQC